MRTMLFVGTSAFAPVTMLACLVGSPTHPEKAPAPTDPPSALVIVLDDVGWSERSTLTSLDDLAAVGTTFTRFYTFPLCSPTRWAALSGRLPRRDGLGYLANGVDSPAPDRLVPLFPEVLLPTHKSALIGKDHLGQVRFEFGSGCESWRAGSYANLASYYSWSRIENGAIETETDYATDAQLDAFLDWWQTTSGPKLGWLAFNAAHVPFETPPGMSAGSTSRQKYLKVVEYLNGALATLFASADLDNTYIVVFGDNGTPDQARIGGSPSGVWKGTTFGHDSTFGGGICTPLIVVGPGVTENATSDRLVSAVDLPATLLELLGLDSRWMPDSESFADELGAWTGEAAREWVFSELYRAGTDDLTVIEPEWKVRVFDADGTGSGSPVTTYFHLPSDQYEVNPLTAAQALALDSGVVARMAGHVASLPSRQ